MGGQAVTTRNTLFGRPSRGRERRDALRRADRRGVSLFLRSQRRRMKVPGKERERGAPNHLRESHRVRFAKPELAGCLGRVSQPAHRSRLSDFDKHETRHERAPTDGLTF
jgi:hypothetical protein